MTYDKALKAHLDAHYIAHIRTAEIDEILISAFKAGWDAATTQPAKQCRQCWRKTDELHECVYCTQLFCDSCHGYNNGGARACWTCLRKK